MLSVIICTYNREKYIRPLLESLAANTFPTSEYEIVFVDNNCSDHTPAVCQTFADAHPDIAFHYFLETEQGLSAARNRGIREAKGDILLFVDDDALVEPHHLQDFAVHFRSYPDSQAVGGPVEPQYETAEPAWMTTYTKALLTSWINLGPTVCDFKKGRYPIGGNMAFRSEVFRQVGLFNTALGRKGTNLMGAEEKDIFDKMYSAGMRVRYIPTPILHHIIPQYRLEDDFFNRLTKQIGISERLRTQAISRAKYIRRLCSECIKWAGTLVLLCGYTLQGHPSKGTKLVHFRYNVTRGLLGIIRSI